MSNASQAAPLERLLAGLPELLPTLVITPLHSMSLKSTRKRAETSPDRR
jgi:hypothetical protein